MDNNQIKLQGVHQQAREPGIKLGKMASGPWNAITDVPGVKVGHTSLISGSGSGEGPLVVGQGSVRTGVTVFIPREGNVGTDPLFAGYHILNGNGEVTGLPWIEEAGLLTTPIAITNTHSIGVVRDALIAYDVVRGGGALTNSWSLPVVADTWDGFLSDINGQRVRPEHVFAALATAYNMKNFVLSIQSVPEQIAIVAVLSDMTSELLALENNGIKPKPSSRV